MFGTSQPEEFTSIKNFKYPIALGLNDDTFTMLWFEHEAEHAQILEALLNIEKSL